MMGKHKLHTWMEMIQKENEMVFEIKSKTKTDKRKATMKIDGHGGRFSSYNSLGKDVARLGVVSDGSGVVDTKDKSGNSR